MAKNRAAEYNSYLLINSSFSNQDSHVLYILKDLIHDLGSQWVPAGLWTMDRGCKLFCLKNADPNAQANKPWLRLMKQTENLEVCFND